MKKIILISVSALPVMFFTFCSYPLSVHKTYAPEITLETRPSRIVFVNIFDYTTRDNIGESRTSPYMHGERKLIEGLSKSFSSDSAFSFVIGDTLKQGIQPGQLTALLSEDSISAICMRNNSDLLLTHDSTSYFFNWETSADEDHLKQKSFYLQGNFYLSLYSANGELINRSKIFLSTYYSTRVALSALITIKPPLSKAINSIESISYEAGHNYINKFYPVNAIETRMLYTGKEFKESDLLIRLKNWDKAIELLEQLSRSNNQNIAMKARHNLAVVREAKGTDGIQNRFRQIN